MEVQDQSASTVRALFWVSGFLLYPHMAEGEEESLRNLFYKGTNLIQEGSALVT